MVETISVFEQEKKKYEEIWQVPEYRHVSFGEQLLGPFLSMTGAKPGQLIIDVGCGTGRATKKLRDLLFKVEAVDATITCLDEEIRDDLKGVFIESCLWHNWTDKVVYADYCYCNDVMEHIPTEFTMLVAAMCLSASSRTFFHINFDPDFFGQKIGKPLHLTVKPFTWWRDRLAEMGKLIDARDMLGHGTFLVESKS